MNMTESLHESITQPEIYPGQYLAKAREARGYSQEYVANKLHLRTQMVQLLETDAYELLPQPVFVQGYFKAYAKLLGIDPKPVLEQYSLLREPEKKTERILRQRDREPGFREFNMRWILIGVSLALMVGIYFWWAHHPEATAKNVGQLTQSQKEILEPSLTDLSQMDTGLSLSNELPMLEHKDG
jgi:cytoskeleton protein RodZ